MHQTARLVPSLIPEILGGLRQGVPAAVAMFALPPWLAWPMGVCALVVWVRARWFDATVRREDARMRSAKARSVELANLREERRQDRTKRPRRKASRGRRRDAG
jgi:type IV secretory pathway TrbD component